MESEVGRQWTFCVCVCVCVCAYAAMKVLDGDDVRLSARGRYAERDIVQVIYTDCSHHEKYVFLIGSVSP